MVLYGTQHADENRTKVESYHIKDNSHHSKKIAEYPAKRLSVNIVSSP